MRLYYVKRDLYGIKAGTVERFADHKAGALVMSGDIEPYDEKRHSDKPGAPRPTVRPLKQEMAKAK